MPSVSLNENSVSAPPESQQQAQPGGPHSYPPPPPHQQQPPPPPTGHHQYPGGGYPPYPGRTGYEHGPPQHHVNNSDPMAVSQQHPYQHPYPPHQQPPMRFPGKPLPGGPPGSQQQQQPPPVSGQYPPQQMRGGYPPTGPMTGQSISQQSGPTPTLNSLLQPGGGGGGAGGSAGGAGATGAPPGSAPPTMPGHGSPHRYPPPPSGYEHNSYNMPPHSKSDYPAGPQGWPPPASNQRPPVNSAYGHPPPPSFQQQQAMYRQNAPPSGGRSGGPPPGQPPQHPGQYYQPPGMHHPPPPHQQGGFPPPPPQSPHYPPPHAQRYPGPGMRPGENQPPSHYPPGPAPGMPPESSGLAPPPGGSGAEGGHPPKSTPPPPQSPSLAQQQMNHAQNNPPSPQQSPRSTPVQSQQHPPTSSAPGGIPPSSSPSHRPQGSSPSNSYPPPPEVGDCNSNDSGPGASGVRPSPSPTGSASSRPMSPAVGSQNIPVPSRPSSSQSDGPPRMSQSPMPGSYPGQPSMAPPPHHGYPPGGKMGHPNAGMIPPGHHPPSPQHYPQGQHWQHQPGQQGYGARPPHHGGMMSPYPPPSQQPMPPNNYPPRHQVPNHVGGPPPPSQYSPYPPPQYAGQQPPSQQAQQPWASPNPPGPGGPPNQRSHPSQHPFQQQHLKQHLQQKMGFSPPPHGQGYPGGPMGPPQSNMSSTSPSQTPPPGSHPQQHLPPSSQQGPPDGDNSNSGGNPPNIVSVGPDGTNVDDVSQQSTLSNTSGASGGDDGPAMPKLRKEVGGHQSYSSHPATPQSNAVPSPGAGSAHEDYGEMNSPGWPRTPASPGLNSHPQPPSEQFKPKAKVKKKPDSLQKLYDMDDNPDRRGFLEKLMQFMDEQSTPITACPTISKNPLDLFRLYFLVKERGGFLEVTKNKTWKDIAGSLGIGASSSAAYTLRKHYTKHLFAFECKFDRGGVDPQPLINQVESTSKKKGVKAAPVPSPGSSNSQDSFQGANNNSTSSMDGFTSASGGPPTPYGVHPPSEYNQANSSSAAPGSGNSGPGGNSSASNNSTPPLRPPAQSPIAPPPQSGPNPPQHSHSGYQGPPGSYPYSSPSGEQYPGRPSHEAYNQQGYGGPGYPPPGPGRPMYSPYPDTSSAGATPPTQSGYPPQGSTPHQSQAPSQQQQPPVSGAGPTGSSSGSEDNRYSHSMPPPGASAAGNAPGQPVNYPSHPGGRMPGYPPTTGAPGHPPPNGYPSQDYYHSQPPPSEQGYTGMPGQTPPHPPGGKHGPPPANQRRLDFQPGKEPGATPPSHYPGYPPQGQPRMPSYGWPAGGSQYPPHQQRSYPPGPPNAGTPPHGTTPPSQSPSPAAQTPPSAAPSQPGAPPTWAPPGAGAPGTPRGPAGATGPPSTPNTPGGQWPHPPPQPDHTSGRYGPGAGTSQASPQSASPGGPVPSQQPPWTPPGGRGAQMRPPFPVPGKPGDMYKQGYGPPPGASPSPSAGTAPGPPPVVPGVKGPPGMPPPPPVSTVAVPGGPAPQATFPPAPPTGASAPGLPLPAAPPPVPVKKEIVFPPDSVEAVTPVLPRRKKLHKNDVAPVEAWRIMMCLKSGLLAETTWALDVLNVLLYDDHSISYFSLSYLPGLLETLLEQLRRALILIFGNSIGIEMNSDKVAEEIPPLQTKRGTWYELEERDEGEEPDIGTPRKKFPRDGHRTVVLQGTTNYTMVSRVGRKTVGIVSRDDEPFVAPGPRDWDIEEKLREANESDLGAQSGNVGNLMELTKHVVTSFTSDLNIVPVVRVLKPETADARSRFKRKRRRSDSAGTEKSAPEIKREPQDCDDDASSELNLEIYRCETKLPNEMVVSSSSSSNHSSSNGSSNCNSDKNSKKNSSSDAVSNSNGSANNTKTEASENNASACSGGNGNSSDKESELKNCLTTPRQNNLKIKKLDEIMDRLKSEVSMDEDSSSEHCDKRVNGLPETDDNSSLMDANSLALEKGSENDCSAAVVNGDVASDTNASGCASNVMTPSGESDVKQPSSLSGTNDCDEVQAGDDSSQNLRNCVRLGSILVQDHGSTLKRRKLDEFEDECYTRDEPSLYQVTESQDALARRCLSIFNILRNLTFVPGNETEFGKSIPFLSLIGKLLLIHHEHPLKGKPTSKKFKLDGDDAENGSSSVDENGEENLDDEEDDGLLSANRGPGDIDVESCTSLNGEGEWWWEYVHHLREHVLVMIANISGQMDLSNFSEEISRPILDGLLHWAVCPAAYGQDTFPTLGPNSNLSPQRLAIEALCKLSVTQGNMDLLLATPPYSRIERLCQLLCRSLCPTEDQVMREFAINLLSYLSAADSGVARTIALQNPCISLLISFIEQAEANANNISMNHGFQVLRENPEAMGTSLDMLRRAATTLFNLARHPDNRALFVQHEPRLLQLVMSHILEQKVAAIVAQVLFQCSAPDSSSSKYFHSGSNYDTFYSISRSRSIVSRNKH